jgi:DNA-binding MarR family transcriptional regulator|tara:strand:- start:1017 stop:1346 length:330 start_codon:yes stop_codon:yes gene_type:complete
MKQISALQNQIKEFMKFLDTSQTSINHMLVFSTICKSHSINSSELSIEMGMKKSTLNRLLHSLATNSRGQVTAAKLIDIEMDMNDRRQRIITLTAKGKSLKNKMFGGKK